jgi:hypothetical protein
VPAVQRRFQKLRVISLYLLGAPRPACPARPGLASP